MRDNGFHSGSFWKGVVVFFFPLSFVTFGACWLE